MYAQPRSYALLTIYSSLAVLTAATAGAIYGPSNYQDPGPNWMPWSGTGTGAGRVAWAEWEIGNDASPQGATNEGYNWGMPNWQKGRLTQTGAEFINGRLHFTQAGNFTMWMDNEYCSTMVKQVYVSFRIWVEQYWTGTALYFGVTEHYDMQTSGDSTSTLDRDSITVTDLGDGHHADVSLRFTINPQPEWEKFTFSAPEGLDIVRARMATQCIPTPGVMAAVLLTCCAVTHRRR